MQTDKWGDASHMIFYTALDTVAAIYGMYIKISMILVSRLIKNKGLS